MSAEHTKGAAPRKRWWQRRWFKIAASLALVGVAVLACALEYVVHNAAPILRKRVIQTLSQRFNAPVELDGLDISLVKGVEISGHGLRIPYANASVLQGRPPVLIGIEHFEFHSDIHSLLHGHTHVGVVYVDGAVIDLPPGDQRGQMLSPMNGAAPADPEHPSTKPKIALLVDRIVCNNLKLVIEVSDPNKYPHEFDISYLKLEKKGGDLSYDYHAKLTNPIPRGEIDARGHLGPWNTDDPRNTPINGDYNFQHADLNTIRGLGGILTSVGHFDGVIDHIAVDGTTDTPDFSLDISDHPLHLKTKFHAYVDGTSGDTTLDLVDGLLGETPIECRGKVQNLKGKGHDIALDAVIAKGRMQDVLYLGMKSKPIMNGELSVKTKIHVPPGKVRVAAKIELAGTLQIQHLWFTNQTVQDKLDGLSMRAQGKPEDVKQASTDKEIEAYSSLKTNFALTHSVVTFNSVDYELPGAKINLDGIYEMAGDAFEFKGHVRTDATASQMVTGWKSWLLKPVDRLLKKDGAGVELPISIDGEKNDFHFALAFNHGDDTPAQIRQELNEKKAAGDLDKKKHGKGDTAQRDTPLPAGAGPDGQVVGAPSPGRKAK